MNPKPRFFNQRGVTLVEVVVVIAVAGILAAVAAPTVSNALRRERAKGFAHEVANTVREARNQAMSRGEAMRVVALYDLGGSTPGRMAVYRTRKALPDGSFVGAACDSETEGISTFDCALGSVCVSDLCEAPPARSCRELEPISWAYTGPQLDSPSGSTRYTRVVYEDFPDTAGSNLGIRLGYSSSTFAEFCISPRGTIEAVGGGAVTPFASGVYSCADEGFNIWVADRDYSTSYSVVLNKMRCDSTAADYEEVRGHVIRVMPNGEVSLRPPRRS